MCVTVQLHLESVKASLRSALSPTLPCSPLPSLFTTPLLLFQHCTNWQLWTRLHTLGNMCRERERDRKASSAFCAAAVAAAAKAQTLLLCPRRRLSKRCQSKSKRKIAPLDCCVVFKIGRKKIETTKKIEIIFSNIVFVLLMDVVLVVVWPLPQRQRRRQRQAPGCRLVTVTGSAACCQQSVAAARLASRCFFVF